MTPAPAFLRPTSISPACTSQREHAPEGKGLSSETAPTCCRSLRRTSYELEGLALRHRHGAAWLASFDVSTELTPVVAPPRKKSGGVNPVAVALLVYLAAVWGAVVWGVL